MGRYFSSVNHYFDKTLESEEKFSSVCFPIQKKNSERIVFSAYMIALAVLFSRFLSIKIPIAGMEALRFGIGGLPIIAAGLFSGVFYGAATGALADILGMMLFPSGPYFPVFTLTSAMTGGIPGLLRNILNTKNILNIRNIFNNCGYFFQCFVIVVITQLLTTVTLVPFFLSHITGLSFEVLFYPRLIVLFFEVPFFSFFLSRLLKLRSHR